MCLLSFRHGFVRTWKHTCAIRHIQRSKPLRFPSPTPSQVYTPPAPKSRKVLDFMISFDFLLVPKTQNMKQLQRPPKIITKTTFVHPRLQFLLICDAFWHPFFMLFHDSVKSPKLQQIQCEILVFALQSLSFWHQKSIPKLCFFKRPFWTHLLMILCWFYTKMVDLGSASKSPVGDKMAPKSSKLR